MPGDPTTQLQAAIRTLLVADAALATSMGGAAVVLDHVPERQVMPYILLREESSVSWDTDESDSASGFGREHTFSIVVWSDYEGTLQARTVLNRVYELLQDRDALTMADHTLVNLRHNFTQVFLEPDGEVYQGISQYRIVTEEK